MILLLSKRQITIGITKIIHSISKNLQNSESLNLFFIFISILSFIIYHHKLRKYLLNNSNPSFTRLPSSSIEEGEKA